MIPEWKKCGICGFGYQAYPHVDPGYCADCISKGYARAPRWMPDHDMLPLTGKKLAEQNGISDCCECKQLESLQQQLATAREENRKLIDSDEFCRQAFLDMDCPMHKRACETCVSLATVQEEIYRLKSIFSSLRDAWQEVWKERGPRGTREIPNSPGFVEFLDKVDLAIKTAILHPGTPVCTSEKEPS